MEVKKGKNIVVDPGLENSSVEKRSHSCASSMLFAIHSTQHHSMLIYILGVKWRKQTPYSLHALSCAPSLVHYDWCTRQLNQFKVLVSLSSRCNSVRIILSSSHSSKPDKKHAKILENKCAVLQHTTLLV